MRTRKVIVLSLISAGAAVLFSGCPSEPPSPCVIGHAGGSPSGNGPGHGYVVQYFLNTDAGFQPSAACSAPAYAYWPSGNFYAGLYVESFGAVTASQKLVGLVPDEFGWTNSYLNDYVQGAPIDGPSLPDGGLFPNPVILGNFTTDTQNANGTCVITQQDGGAGIQTFVPTATPDNGATVLFGPLQTVTYEIPVALVYTNQAAGEGTQIQFAARITRDDGVSGACVRNYIGIGLWPAALCNVNNDCNPNPQPTNGRPLGSGILTGIPTTCNLNIGSQSPVVAANNYPAVPNIPCATDGQGTDTCMGFADGDAGVGVPPYTTCSNIVTTPITPTVACTPATKTSIDSCLDGGPGGICTANPDGGTSFCSSSNGVCAQPVLDAIGCGQGTSAAGLTFITISTNSGCGGGAVDNNNTGGTGICFYPNAAPNTFPYLTSN